MALIRHPNPHLPAIPRPMCRLAARVSLAALLAGCSQSLFANPGDGSGAPDGGEVDFDGGDDRPDAGPGVPDARPGEPPDAAPPDCPVDCVDHAVASFSTDQGGKNGRWLYVADTGGPFGADYYPMTYGTLPDGAPAWIGSAAPFPGILHCPTSQGDPSCQGVGEKLLFEVTGLGGSGQPALLWTQPETPRVTYRMSGAWQLPVPMPGSDDVRLMLVRNSLFDSLLDQRITQSDVTGTFDVLVDAHPRDQFRLLAVSGSSELPLALSFYINDAPGGACQIATDFTGSDSEPGKVFNACHPFAFQDGADDPESCESLPCPPTTVADGPFGLEGNARRFVEGSSMEYQGVPNDYSGDWTVQFWVYLDSLGSTVPETVVSDADCREEKGINVFRTNASGGNSEIIFEAYSPDDAFAGCIGGGTQIGTGVSNDTWNFFRFTRTAATQSLSLCVNGNRVDERGFPGTDMSAPTAMLLGRNVTSKAEFRGRLADLRVLTRALPCNAP
jgi:hypothetical protein